ncbi:MAG TPA: hypothetical protein VFT59_04425, partial [Candidatus Saccharimonadales bacterium]|nr:hypothetical protein [Candidatus Saccharimonadales bacterium]
MTYNQETRLYTRRWLHWVALGFVALIILVVIILLAIPKPLVVKGTLKTSEGPVSAGTYDFRLKFYDVTTRTDLVYSHDATGVLVDANGSFDVELPGGALTVATLMQVCVASPNTAEFDQNKTTIPSCEDPAKTDEIVFDQTVCGLTTVDQEPTNPVNWLASRNVVYTMPVKACGGMDGEVASISGNDIITPLLERPGSLGELLSGVDLQPGTILGIDDNGQLETIAPTTLDSEINDETSEETANNNQPVTPTTPASPVSPTSIQGEANTDNQTLLLSGNILSISGGNSVILPDGSDGDPVIGNEVVDVTANAGLVRAGSGTVLDPYKLGLQTCANGEILKSDGSSWACTPDTGGSSYLAGSGLQLSGVTFSVNSPTCTSTTKLQWDGNAFVCSTDIDTTYTAGTGLSLVGTTFNNTGVLGVNGTGPITSTGGQNPTISFANGTSAGQVWQWNGSAWALTTPSADGDGVIGNEITNVTGGNAGLTRSGSGTAGDPYTLAANTGNGLQLVSNQITVNSPTCSGTDKLQWNGTAFICATDQNTTYSAVTNGGLQLVGTQFGLVACAGGQILKATSTLGEYACATDNDTTYSAGTGLSLTGTTFSNTGVLSVTGSGPITSTGGQNPNISFANGSVAGQFWQWNGSAWVLATLPADGDSVVGNEVTNVTGSNSGLVRSGTGTSVDPYTLAVSISNGLQLTGGNVAINSPTCTGTDKLQWTGTAFVCTADVNTTYSAGSGLSLAGTTFTNTGALSVTASGALTSSGGQTPNIAFANGSTAGQFWQWNGSAWVLATLPNDGDSVVGNEVTDITGVNSGLVRSGSGTAVDPYTLAVSVGNGLQLVGGNVAINSPTCAGTTKLQWNGTAFMCSTDVDTTNFSITDGATNQSVNAGESITFVGDSNSKTTVTLGGTRQLTFGLDTTGALSGQVLAFNGSGVVWQTPSAAAPVACSISSTYFCQDGNTFGATATLGTNDTQTLNFETNNTVQMTVLPNGNVGIGVSPTEKLDVNGNINFPSTTATTGIIKQGGVRLIHTKDDGSSSSFFGGLNSGNLTTTGFDNVGIGSNALLGLTTGFYNTAVGSGALTANTDGIYNTAVGAFSMEANTEGYYNSAFGERTLSSNIDGFNNTAIGSDALFDNTSGAHNTGLGVSALGGNTTGTNNVAVGEGAGVTSALANENTTGSNNTFLGYMSGLGSSTQRSNSTAIGAFSVVNQNDSLILGCITGVNGCTARTRIGVGTATPQNMLHIDGGAGAVTTMAQFTNSTTGQTSNDGFNFGIDQNGTA